MQKKWAKLKIKENHLISNDGQIFNAKTGKLLKPKNNKTYILYLENSKKQKSFNIIDLLFTHFDFKDIQNYILKNRK